MHVVIRIQTPPRFGINLLVVPKIQPWWLAELAGAIGSDYHKFTPQNKAYVLQILLRQNLQKCRPWWVGGISIHCTGNKHERSFFFWCLFFFLTAETRKDTIKRKFNKEIFNGPPGTSVPTIRNLTLKRKRNKEEIHIIHFCSAKAKLFFEEVAFTYRERWKIKNNFHFQKNYWQKNIFGL